MNNLVSILIPAYNADQWIGDTIRSALDQTWPLKEIIVVDDGSSDNTLRTAKTFASKIVKVVAQDNGGACVARNTARSFAQGDYIQWLDADDLLAPDKISAQLKDADCGRHSRTLLTSAFGTFFFRHHKAQFEPTSLWQDFEPLEWILARFTTSAWMNPAAWLVSRRLTELAGPWDERLARSGDDDGEYVCRLAAASDKVHFVPTARSYYRRGLPASLSTRRSDGAYEALLLSTKLCTQHLLSLEDSERTRAACIMLLENRLWHFHPEKRDLIRECENLAKEFGGNTLQLRETRKYLLVGKYCGWNTAKRTRNIVFKVSTLAHKNWDRFLYEIAR
jgi:glycosyltransferase involved in cell wall biosynthesis